MAMGGKVTRMPKETSDWITAQASACLVLTCPEGIGREAVRATEPSILRSVMSFQVQPAPRIRKAPMPQPAKIHRSNSEARPSCTIDSKSPHQQGSSSSQVPMGRSARDSRR